MSSSAAARKLEDEQTLHRLAAELRSGATRSEALRRLGVSESTFYRELRRSPELRKLVDSAGTTLAANGESAPTTATVSPVEPKARAKGGRSAATRKTAAPAGAKAGVTRPPGRSASSRKVLGAPAPASKTRPAASGAAHGPRPVSGGEKPARAAQRPTPRRRPAATPSEAPAAASRTRTDRPARTRGTKRQSAPEPATQDDEHTSPPVATALEAPPAAPASRVAGLTGLLRRPAVLPTSRPVAAAEAAPAPMADVPGPEAVTGRRSLTAPSQADWLPPVAVLALQLLVAIAVGASLLVILLVAVTTAGVLFAVQRARRVAPRRGYVEGVRYSETLFVADAGTNGTQPHGGAPPEGAAAHGSAKRGDTNGHPTPDKARRTDLDWVAASILPGSSSPDDPQPPRGHS